MRGRSAASERAGDIVGELAGGAEEALAGCRRRHEPAIGPTLAVVA